MCIRDRLQGRFRFTSGRRLWLIIADDDAEFEGLDGNPESEATFAVKITSEIQSQIIPLGITTSKIGECLIVLGPDWLGPSDADSVDTLIHELAHCFQFELSEAGGVDLGLQPDWLIEGSATWIASQYMLETRSTLGWISPWTDYFSDKEFDLFGASYNDVNFWQQAANKNTGANRGPYITILNALQSSTNSVEILRSITDILQEDFLPTWSSSSFRNVDYGPPWEMFLPEPVDNLGRSFIGPESLETRILADFGTSRTALLSDNRIFSTPHILSLIHI